MRIYLDVCCLNRPFDDQSQDRIRLESEAVKLVLDLVGKGRHTWVSSEAVEYEVSRHPSEARRERLTMLLEQAGERLLLDTRQRRSPWLLASKASGRWMHGTSPWRNGGIAKSY